MQEAAQCGRTEEGWLDADGRGVADLDPLDKTEDSWRMTIRIRRSAQSLRHHTGAFVTAGCALALLLVGMAVPAGADSGAWVINSSYSAGLDSVACPSPSACDAVGPPVLTTKNGASTWHPRSVAANSSLRGLSCPAVSTCFGVGEDMSSGTGLILVSTDSGKTWAPQTPPPGVWVFNGVSCATSLDCVAVGESGTGESAVATTTSGGSKWILRSVPGAQSLAGVSCPTGKQCFAVGTTGGAGVMLASSDGGRTWAPQTLPPGAHDLNGITCLSASRCYADGTPGNSTMPGIIDDTTNGGSTWTGQIVPSGISQLDAIACMNGRRCFAGGFTSSGFNGAILATSDAGTTWTSQPVPSSVRGIGDIACPSTHFCVAVGGTLSGSVILTDAA
jgi:photosystem II stability/assembly factor-like uncharacterized protein